MNWLTPGLAAAAAATLIPLLVLLYFLKLRRREIEVSTTLLWKRSIEDMRANAPFQKLRRNLLLFLQLLVLAAGLLALAQPEIAATLGDKTRHIIVIDRSASMSATDGAGGGARLDQAKREALAFVTLLREPGVLNVGPRDESMVIAFDAGAEVLQPWTADKSRLRAAIESIAATDAPTRIDEAVRLSGAYAPPVLIENTGLVSQATAPMHVWTDGRIADVRDVLLPSVTPMTYHRVGDAATENVGIVGLRAERDFNNPSRLSVFVGLRSTAPQPRDAEIELAIDGLVVAIRSAPMSAAGDDGPGVGGVVFTFDRPEGGLARVRLTQSDALAADDSASLVIPPARRLAVALVTEDDPYTRWALEGMSLARLRSFSPAEYAAAPTAELAGFDVTILSGWAPAEPLAPGRYLIFGALPVIDGMSSAGARDEPSEIIDWTREHPMFRAVSLDGLVIARDLALEVREDLRVLARSSAGPTIVEATSPGVRAIVVSFTPGESMWPFDPGFVLTLANTLRSLGDSGTAAASEPIRPGEVVSTRVPVGVDSVELRSPGGATRTLIPAPDGTVTFGPVARAGVYELRWAGEPGPTDIVVSGRAVRVLAANLLDADESDIRSAATLDLASRVVQASEDAGGSSERRRLWPWLLAAALAVVMLEWWVYQNRARV